MNETDNSLDPLQSPRLNDSGALTYARYRYQALIAAKICLHVALSELDDLVAIEQHSDLLWYQEPKWRFIEIKTREEHLGPWTLSGLIQSDAIWQLWQSFVRHQTANARYEVFLEGKIKPDDNLALMCQSHETSKSAYDRVTSYLTTKQSDISNYLLEQFFRKLVVRGNLPRKEVISDVTLSELGRLFPSVTFEILNKAYLDVVKLVDHAMDAKTRNNDWIVTVSHRDFQGDSPVIKENVVNKPDLKNAIRPLLEQLQSEPSREELRFLFERVRTVGLDRCVIFRPENLNVEEVSNLCIRSQVVRERDYDSLRDRLGKQHSLGEEEADYLFPTSAILSVDLTRRIPRESLEHAFSRERNTIVRGEPGEGKSTALWLYAAKQYRALEEHLARRQWEASAENSTNEEHFPVRIPLVFSLKDVPKVSQNENISQHSLAGMAIESLLEYAGVSLSRRESLRLWIQQQFEEKRVELLLDALDELPQGKDQWLRDQLALHRNLRVIVTTRPTADDRTLNLPDPERLRMVCFGRNEATEFVRRFFAEVDNGSEIANELLRRLDQSPSIRALTQVPLLLAILCDANGQGESQIFPGNRSELLGLGVRQMMRRGATKRGEDTTNRLVQLAKSEALAEIAWNFTDRNPQPLAEDQCIKLIRIKTMDAATLLHGSNSQSIWGELQSDGIITKRGEGRFSFVLRSFHEYFAAWKIANMFAHVEPHEMAEIMLGNRENWQREDWPFRPIRAHGWREIWILLAGLVNQPSLVADVLQEIHTGLEDVHCSQAILLAHFLAEWFGSAADVKPTEQRTGVLCQELLSHLFKGLLSDGERIALERAVGVLPFQVGQKALVAVLSDRMRTSADREIAAEALGWIGGPMARTAVIESASNEDEAEVVRGRSIVALAWVGGAKARQTVRELWHQKLEPRLRMASMVALADLGDATSIQCLVDLIQDDSRAFDLRGYALLELSQRGCWEGATWAQNNLERALKQPEVPRNWELGESCAMALGELRDHRAVAILAEVARCKATPDKVAIECLESLAKIGNRQSRDELLKMGVKGPRGFKAAVSRGELGEPGILVFLAEELARASTSASDGIAIVRGIGGIETEDAERALLDRLTDPKVVLADVRGEILKTLSRRRGVKAIVEARINGALSLFSDRQESIKLEAAIFLARETNRGLDLDQSKVESMLLAALTSRELSNGPRSRALSALALIDSESSRNRISELAFGDDAWLERMAIEAAAIHARRFGWRLLKDGIWIAPN